jgi:hypothetical protein
MAQVAVYPNEYQIFIFHLQTDLGHMGPEDRTLTLECWFPLPKDPAAVELPTPG